MNVEIGAEAPLFPEKEYIKGIAVAVCMYREMGGVSWEMGGYVARWVAKLV
jgi:hypothetical protein